MAKQTAGCRHGALYLTFHIGRNCIAAYGTMQKSVAIKAIIIILMEGITYENKISRGVNERKATQNGCLEQWLYSGSQRLTYVTRGGIKFEAEF